MFGISAGSVQNYFTEVKNVYLQNFVPKLFRMIGEEEIVDYIPKEIKNNFPHCRFIVDGTHFQMQVPANFLLQRLMYSGYKRMVTCQVVIGEVVYIVL